MAYPNITPLPTPPSPDAPATFDTLAYPFTVAQVAMVAQINALVGQLNDTFFPDMPVRATLRGSAALPVYTFNADPDTGMWSPAANALAFSTGGIERLRITSAGLLTSATAITQGYADTASGRLLKVSDFGLGGPAGSLSAYGVPSITNLPPICGFISTAGTADPDRPTGGNYVGFQAAIAFEKNRAQMLIGATSGLVYTRGIRDTGGLADVALPWRRMLADNDVTQSTTDATAGRLLKVGDFGFGSSAVHLADFNETALANGFYRTNNTTANYDSVLTNQWGVLVAASSGNTLRQIYMPDGTSSQFDVRRMFIRFWTAGTWTPWQYFFTSRNIVGTVSADGSGLPTGAVIERGSNANGEFVKFADGTMICWSPTLTYDAVTTAVGAGFRSSDLSWTFPAAFSDGTTVTASGQSSNLGRWISFQLPGTISVTTRLLAFTSFAGSETGRITAIGRWR